MINHSIKAILLLPVLILLFTIESCDGCPEDFSLERESIIAFRLYDADTEVNLLQIASKYRRDCTTVVNEKGQLVFPGPAPGDGLIAFSPLFENEEFEVGQPRDDLFFLQLVQPSVPGRDIDTMRLRYLVHIDDCDEKEFTYINFYYNDELIYEKTNWSRDIPVSAYK